MGGYEKKLELFYFALKFQSALISRLDQQNITAAEESYAALRDKYFAIKNSVEISNAKIIEESLQTIQASRVALLNAYRSSFNQNLIGLIESKLIEFQDVNDTTSVKKIMNELISKIKLDITSVCDLKHRLLFFELNTAFTQTTILEWLITFVDDEIATKVQNNILLIQSQIEISKKYYQSFVQPVNYNQALTINAELESYLENFYDYRNKLQNDFSQVINCLKKSTPYQQLLSEIENLLLSINDFLEKIIRAINHSGDVTELLRTNFEVMLDYAARVAKEFYLVRFLQDKFMPTYRLNAINLLLQCWLQELQKRGELIKNKYPNKLNVARVLAIKQLLFDHKGFYYFEFFKKFKHVDVIERLIERVPKNSQIKSEDFFQLLLNEQQKLRKDVRAAELILSNYTFSLNFQTGLIRLINNNWYFQVAKKYVTSAHQLTSVNVIKNIPIIGTQFTHSQLQGLAILQTAVFVCIEIGIAQAWGISSSLMSTLIQLAMPDITTLNKAGQYFRADEIDVINSLPSLKWFTGLLIQCLLHISVTKDVSDLMFPTGRYIASTLMRKLVVSMIDYLLVVYKKKDAQQSPILDFARFFAENGAYFLGAWMWGGIHPTVKTFFSRPTDDDLLRNSALCEQYASRCKSVALKTLELSEDASIQDVKEKYKELVFRYHPDKGNQPYAGSFFENIPYAKRRAIECINDVNVTMPTFNSGS